MTTDAWVFGYGSLVSPDSVGSTIGRPVDVESGFAAAVLRGYGRSWNYGSLRQRATWDGPHGRVESGIVVSLGLVAQTSESVNGAVVRVGADELAELDRRESDYDRVDVTERVERIGDAVTVAVPSRVFTYVPRASAIERYEQARVEFRAAVRQGYVDLVERAFASLGVQASDRYRQTTPAPDVPIVAPERVWLEPHPADGDTTRGDHR